MADFVTDLERAFIGSLERAAYRGHPLTPAQRKRLVEIVGSMR